MAATGVRGFLKSARLLLLAGLASAAGLSGPAAATPETPGGSSEARRLLLESLGGRATAYVGEQVIERPRGPRLRQQVYRSGNRLRIEFPGGQVVLDDGTTQLRYMPHLGIVERGPSDLAAPRVRAIRRAVISGRALVEQLPDDTVAGRPTHVLRVRSPDGSRPDRTVWVDKETGVQLRQDTRDTDGTLLSTYFTRIQVGVEPPAGKLQPTWPPETPVVERVPGRPVSPAAAERMAQAWGGLRRPSSLPPGYRLRGLYRQSHFRGGPVIATVYDNPAARTTLIIRQGPAAAMEGSGGEAGKPAVSERRGDAVVSITGPHPEPQLRQVLASM
jgi:hypothetical protein